MTDDRPVLRVSWRDAFFDYDAHDASEIRPDYLVQTVGFLLADGPKFVSLAAEILPNGDGFRAITHIPTKLVKTREVLG